MLREARAEPNIALSIEAFGQARLPLLEDRISPWAGGVLVGLSTKI